MNTPKPSRDHEQTVGGFTFTEWCRRLLTEQPNQHEFTLSRPGLETLVLDSERYGEQNAKLAERAATLKRAYPDPIDIDSQMIRVTRNWPGAVLYPPHGNGTVGQWLEVPVELPKEYKHTSGVMYILLPEGYPYTGPHRFYLRYEDASLEHGGLPKLTSRPQTIEGRTLCEFFWKIVRWDGRAMDLFTYVKAMQLGIAACAKPYERD